MERDIKGIKAILYGSLVSSIFMVFKKIMLVSKKLT
jgi:hypothetical protein